MPGRHELATSRWSWLAIIPTCLAKIGILVPARGDCGLGGYFASKARHGGSRRGYRSLLLTVGCSSSNSSSGSTSGTTGSGTNWANYGTIMKDFTAKYGIKINDANPDGSSQDELNAVNQPKGQDRAPDVLDMGTAFAVKGAQQGILARTRWRPGPASRLTPRP